MKVKEREKFRKYVTLIDTPGHGVFFSMRENGSSVADLALIMIDASEGMLSYSCNGRYKKSNN